MAFPLLGLASGVAGGAALRYGPHIFRYLYPRVAPKMVTGAKGLGQLMKPNLKNPLVIGGAIGSILDNINEAHAPSNPYLQNSLNPYGPFMPYTAPRTEMPLGFDQHPPMPNALESTPQELKPHVSEQTQPLAPASPTPPPELTDAEKFLQSNTYKFFQSDAYQKLKDLFAGMAAAPTDGSGWDALASGVKHLNEGDKQRGQVNQTVEYLKSKGYSEEEAAVMVRNPQMLSAMLTNTGRKDFNDGTSLIDDPTSPTGKRVVYNPGSKAYMENKRAASLIKSKQIYGKVLIDDIDLLQRYADKFGNYATGHMAKAASYVLSGSEQSDARLIIQSIKSRIALDRIDQMKMLSPRGTIGLGNVSDKDIEMLKQSLGDLSFDMSPQEFKRRLNIIKTVISKLNSEVVGILLGDIDPTEENMINAVNGNHSQYSSDQLMSQGGSKNIPTMKWQEGIDRDDITVFIDASTGKRIEKEEY
ncbi:hypothetical protein ABID23_001494 [Bartonella silvatica]|uniref:Uncharacterized protein n=1 Tax=Bartonella silvatica TaxID=357760 RepID=A0ABV2HIL3_9HYPH